MLVVVHFFFSHYAQQEDDDDDIINYYYYYFFFLRKGSQSVNANREAQQAIRAKGKRNEHKRTHERLGLFTLQKAKYRSTSLFLYPRIKETNDLCNSRPNN